MAVKRGRLVAFEGLDGCGKSTQLARLRARLDGERTFFTREPTDGPHGRQIRAAARKGDPLDPAQELAWFRDDRREHVDREIEPALAAGRWVVTDRYFLSTVAYQGARGLDWHAILRESEASFPVPDLVLLFELDPAIGLARIEARGGTREPLFEREAFQHRVAAIFAALERPYIRRIDAAQDEDAVESEVVAALRAVGAPVPD